MDNTNELQEIIRYLDDEEITGEYRRELDNAEKENKSSEKRRLLQVQILAAA